MEEKGEEKKEKRGRRGKIEENKTNQQSNMLEPETIKTLFPFPLKRKKRGKDKRKIRPVTGGFFLSVLIFHFSFPFLPPKTTGKVEEKEEEEERNKKEREERNKGN